MVPARSPGDDVGGVDRLVGDPGIDVPGGPVVLQRDSPGLAGGGIDFPGHHERVVGRVVVFFRVQVEPDGEGGGGGPVHLRDGAGDEVLGAVAAVLVVVLGGPANETGDPVVGTHVTLPGGVVAVDRVGGGRTGGFVKGPVADQGGLAGIDRGRKYGTCEEGRNWSVFVFHGIMMSFSRKWCRRNNGSETWMAWFLQGTGPGALVWDHDKYQEGHTAWVSPLLDLLQGAEKLPVFPWPSLRFRVR